RRKHVKPNQIVIKGQANDNQEENVRNGNSGKNGNPGDGARGRPPKIVKFVEPFFDSPDIRVSGKVHWGRAPSVRPGSVDSERVRYAGGQDLHDAGRVKDHGDSHGQHDELKDPGVSRGEG